MSVSSAEGRYHSRFGGMWIDRSDFDLELKRRVRDGQVPRQLETQLREFENNGVVILPGAASDEALNRYEAAISRAFRDGHEHLIAVMPGDNTPQPVTAMMNRRGVRIVDSFAVIPEALDLFCSPRLLEFFETVFDEPPLLFQSLSFDMGSEQGLHQDTAYVVVNRPMELLACWIALEDVRPGSGELQYILGSHRFPDFDFGGKKHYAPSDGVESHAAWAQWIWDEGARRALPTQKFMAKRGDILVWHADLAHGGAPVTDQALTRRSLVGHFCPRSATPHFMSHAPERTARRDHGRLSYCSFYYDVSDAASPGSRSL